MILTKAEREILVAAREFIADELGYFICLALVKVDDGDCLNSVRLREYVRAALKPQTTLGDWQFANGFGRRSGNQRRIDRINWINWMLAGAELPE